MVVKEVISMRYAYDPDVKSKGFPLGYYICDVCTQETDHPVADETTLHKETCEVRHGGRDHITFYYGPASIESARKWKNDCVAGVPFAIIQKHLQKKPISQ
jgi:hypothetical protein